MYLTLTQWMVEGRSPVVGGKGEKLALRVSQQTRAEQKNIFFQRTRQNQEQIFREQDKIDFSEEIKKYHTWPSTTKELGSFLRLTTRLT